MIKELKYHTTKEMLKEMGLVGPKKRKVRKELE